MGKSQNLLSPEKYIRTKARALPVHECWINDLWRESGLATVIVCRRQPSGNFVVGAYLVDLLCLGVKDCIYFFNHSTFDYRDLITSYEGMSISRCDYSLAHNVIYAGLEYAQEYNISPDKNFSTAQFILEDIEDESIPVMDIECGENGRPHLLLPEEDVAKYNKALAQLRSYPGEGKFGYTIRSDDEFGSDDDDGDAENEQEEDEDEEDGGDWDDTPLPDDFFDKVERGEESAIGQSPHALMDLLYRKKFPDHLVDIDAAERYADSLDITFLVREDVESGTPYEREKAGEIYHLLNENAEKALPQLRDLVTHSPKNKLFSNLLHLALIHCDMPDEANEVAEKAYRDFPGYLFAHINYAMRLLSARRYDEIPSVMYDPSSISRFVSGRQIDYVEALSFFSFWSQYFLDTGDMASGEYYYRVMWAIAPGDKRTYLMRKILSAAKSKAVMG